MRNMSKTSKNRTFKLPRSTLIYSVCLLKGNQGSIRQTRQRDARALTRACICASKSSFVSGSFSRFSRHSFQIAMCRSHSLRQRRDGSYLRFPVTTSPTCLHYLKSERHNSPITFSAQVGLIALFIMFANSPAKEMPIDGSSNHGVST